jgi:RND superfamily putative drug exporter
MAGRDVACSARAACWQSSSVLFLSFTAMASGPDTQVKMHATGLAAGILLDATVIRALVVPAVVALMGRWNWWLARWPARLLRVQPSVLARVRTETPE